MFILNLVNKPAVIKMVTKVIYFAQSQKEASEGEEKLKKNPDTHYQILFTGIRKHLLKIAKDMLSIKIMSIANTHGGKGEGEREMQTVVFIYVVSEQILFWVPATPLAR